MCLRLPSGRDTRTIEVRMLILVALEFRDIISWSIPAWEGPW